ncbi:DUF6538 domain-containing protein [Phenylobacterium sp. VNQ135]|uniref:DUF6538 domain-containing protein n=1 Tax=Phenylobacterium sp. VNQ135 TaxID=3400922 RepID=UPI003C028253
MKHLQRRSGIWYVRIVIPPDARHAFEKPVFIRSLKTKNDLEAARLGAPIIQEVLKGIERARSAAPERHRASASTGRAGS